MAKYTNHADHASSALYTFRNKVIPASEPQEVIDQFDSQQLGFLHLAQPAGFNDFSWVCERSRGEKKKCFVSAALMFNLKVMAFKKVESDFSSGILSWSEEHMQSFSSKIQQYFSS